MYSFVASLFICVVLCNSWCSAERRNPLKDPKICGRPQCDLETSKFVYKSLVKYKYNYRSHVRTEFHGTGQNTSDIFVTAAVQLIFPQKCEGEMEISEIELRNAPLRDSSDERDGENNDDDFNTYDPFFDLHKKSSEFAYEIQKHKMRFAFQDGIIGELCPNESETNWVINFKRGILSSLQNSMQRLDIDHKGKETDISGTCDVNYVVNGASETSLIIQKHKDISTCQNRYKTNSILQTTPYDFRKHYTAWPVLQSTSYCNITVDHNIYQKVVCFEHHQLLPFSNNASGATTTSTIKLSLADEETYEIMSSSGYDEEEPIKRRETLLFNHFPTPKPTTGEIRASRELLQKMCKLGFPDIKRQFIDVFSKFLQTAKFLSSGALHQLLSRASSICTDSRNGKNHILESLPYIGSAASVKMMATEIIKRSVTPQITQKWLSSMSFLPRPDEEMLESLYSLLELADSQPDPMLVLTPTAVVHTFCRLHSDCGENEKVRRFIGRLEESIQKSLGTNLMKRSNREKIIVLLKGLSNIGILSKSFASRMKKIIENDNIPTEIRLHAVTVHRRSDCARNRVFFIDVYRNFTGNSEVRIAAYLEAMRCPDYISMKHIKFVLKNEVVNQVGSFVWSHLKNTAKSASPVRVEAQGLLVDEDLGTKYRMDLRKFSQNFERSIFFDEYNLGASGDSNLIFGTDSYLPRSASMNFTVDLFGESINIFEVNAYMQGFEHMVEGMFGPRGPLSTEGFSKKLDSATQYVKDKITPLKSEYLDNINLRLRRGATEEKDIDDDDVEEETYEFENENSDRPKAKRNNAPEDAIQKEVNELNYRLKYDMNSPRAAFGLKMFGNDIKYKTLEGVTEISALLLHLNPTAQIQRLLSGQEIIYTKSGVFLEASYEVPLSSGFPLAVQAYGASSIDLRMQGSLAGKKFWPNPRFAVKGKIKPSISLDVVTTMQSDYFFGSTGVRVKSNLYSSSSIEANLTVDGLKYVSLQFGLPQDRNDIISAKSDLYVLQYESEIRQRGINKRYANSTCTWPAIERVVGLKVCSNYSLPDVSHSESQRETLPSLLLCGPININIHIDKADLTAKSYLFEYKWIDQADRSTGSFIFETPHTAVPRIFVANITHEPNIYNLSMSFVNGATEHSAIATYKNTEDEKLIEAHIHMDGQQSFALEMGMNRSQINHGWIYYPRFTLAVNNDQIAGLSGDVKMVDKRNIVQYDTNLSFATKKFETGLKGFILKTDLKYTTRLLLNYQFKNRTMEYIELDSEFGKKTDKISGTYTGMVKWNSTAYAKYNFATDFKYTQVLGHIDLMVNINNAVDFVDPRYNLGVHMIVILASEDKDYIARSMASLEIVRPISRFDYKFLIKHESKYKNGKVDNFLFLIRYAKDKEATAVVSAMLPSTYSHNTDVYVNVTVPSFGSSTVHVKATEQKSNQYFLRMHGAWFTGQSIKIDGIYEDKSSLSEASHHLKLVVRSPYFNETNIVAVYIYNDTGLVLDTRVQYGVDHYGLVLKHAHVTLDEQSVYGEVRIRQQTYSLSANLNNKISKRISIDLHIDGVRDIQIILRGHSTALRKETGIEIKWDANRDDTQKLVLTADFNTPKHKVYDGGFTFSYPDRTFSGSFDLSVPGPLYRGNVSIGWSANDAIDFSFDSGTLLNGTKTIWLISHLRTPFDGWHRNSFDSHLVYAPNFLSTNASVLWANTQRLGIGLLIDFDYADPNIRFETKLFVNSTVKDVPTIDAIFKHIQNSSEYNTDASLRHVAQNEKPNVYAIKSTWQLNFSELHRNISGSVSLNSPMKGYTKGALVTKFSLSSNRMVHGAADVELEGRKFTLAVEGTVKKFTNCMLEMNVTTPIEKYRNIKGRFGLIDRNRHVVAELRAPNAALGIEIKFAANAINNFDVIFNVETPIASLEKAMLVAKLQSDVIDFRGGLNKFVLGYVAVSRKLSLQDFEYSWKVYTPLPKFEESRLVVKFVHRKMVDLEVMLKFAGKKLGIVIDGKPKQKFIRLPRISSFQFESRLADEFDRFSSHFAKLNGDGSTSDSTSEESSEEDTDAEDDWNIAGHMELDTIVWPTISGSLDIEDIGGEDYIVTGNLILPIGTIEFRNQLYFPDYMNIQNSLRVISPYVAAKEIEFLYSHTVEFGQYYISAMELFYKNDTRWIELGYNSNYTKQTDDAELKMHEIEMNFLLPFETLPRISFGCGLELEGAVTRANVSGRTIDTYLSLAGSLENDLNFIDVNVGLRIDAPMVPNYWLNVFFKKELSDVENMIAIGFEERNNQTSKASMESVWHIESSNYVKFSSKFSTNLSPLTVVETSLFLNRTANFQAAVDLSYVTFTRRSAAFHVDIAKRNEQLNIEIQTPLADYANITMIGSMSLISKQTGRYNLAGKLYRNHEIYNIDGTMTIASDFPVEVDLQLKPVSRNAIGFLTYSLRNSVGYGKSLQFKVMEGNTYFEVITTLNIYSKLNWNLDASINTSPGILSRKSDQNRCELMASLHPDNSGRVTAKARLQTPWRQLGIDLVTLNGSALIAAHTGDAQIAYDLSQDNGRAKFAWTFVVFENMNVLLDFVNNKAEYDPRSLRIGIRYVNPGRNSQRLTFGGSFAVDSKWHLETNGSMMAISKNDVSANLAIRLPEPLGDVHRFSGHFDGDLLASPLKSFMYEASYESEKTRKRFASRGQYRNVTDLQALLRAQWGLATKLDTFESNVQMLRKGKRREMSATMKTPLYIEDTMTASGSYDNVDAYYLMSGVLKYPASHQIANTDIKFSSISNMYGFLNCSTPFAALSWLQTDLNYTSTGAFSRRFIKAQWPRDYAFFDLQNAFESRNLDRDHHGTIDVEVPLATRHTANIEYGLKERNQHTTGHCNVIYNKASILNGQYVCKSESRAGFNKDSISMILENKLKPLGIIYVHQAEQSGPDPPYFDMKHAEIYELRNSSRFNITGELHIRTTMTGQAYKILAVHPNRTVVVTSDYDFHEATTRHRSKLQLAEEIWIAYDLKLQNLTSALNDSQNIDFKLSYPKRNLSTSGWYAITEDVFDSDFNFKWTIDKNAAPSADNNYDDYGDHEDTSTAKRVVESEERAVRGALKWQNEPLSEYDRSNQTIRLTLMHPSFAKDVTFDANYYRSDIDLVRGKIIIDYNEETDHLVTFQAGLMDYKSIIGHRNYTLHAFGHHEISEFDLNALASVAAQPGIYETKNYGMYRRNVVPLENSQLNAGINLPRNEVHYRKESTHKTFFIWLQADGEYPIYTWNATFEDSPDVNTTAEFFVDIDGRFVRLDANFTPDASQNLRLYGIVPDARSATFNLWRDYEDIRIVDISYYLRMNHSRLITSKLIWRPKLKKEIMEKFQQTAKQFYDTFSENIEFWVKKLHSECGETINDVWTNARPHAQDFLDDISGLRVIESDFEEFRKFLNQSYESDDFYLKTMVNCTLTVLDELAIRNHIGSVPKILNEIRQLLGDSGAALRKNILWLIETIKTSYKNAVEVLTRIFHGEAMSYVSVLVEKAVDSYDKIVKELHLKFIKYVQNMWNRVSDSITDYWRKLLNRIQPTFMKFFHYAESVLWRISQELFEFLHKRTNEIVESPYYDTISKFTQDMDRVYHDIQTNDAFTNIRKYASLVWDFLQEKYFEVVPFAKELQNITNELSDEIWQLQKQELVQFVLIRVNEWKVKFAWFAEEFQLDRRAQQLWQIIIAKITAYEQTALQSDDKYREAKTYFVFDPDTGLMKLEQKLPMSWHAFNETPLFEEISEFKMIGKAFRVFNGVNVTLFNPFEQMQYYTNPYTWLPPFKSRSIMVGSRHYITFDKQIISLNRHKYAIINGQVDKPDQCSYLLAHDFVDSNFTLIQEPATNMYQGQFLATRKLALAADENVFDVDMVGASIRINRNQTTTLPIQIGDTVIYRDTDILVVRSNNGFQLNCNLQFDLCWFELSGWYYGKTAGLLGTMNNEIFDESLASNHVITQDPIAFKNSWALKQCTTQDDDDEDHKLHGEPKSVSNELLNICDTFFRSKISQFVNCFAVVDSLPFFNMCLDMGANSISNFTEVNHPAQKGSCAVALAYIETCMDENVPLRVPDICVHCDLNNGSYVAEGKIFDLKDKDVPLTTDIVFIVEAKPCNHNLNQNKNLLAVLSSLNKQLNESGFADNRFAVIAFGGDPPFDRPNSIVYLNHIFSNANNIRHYFDHIRTGNGSQTTDVSHAIKVASDLVFRPGASKTFILLPCSHCNVTDMRFDYSSIHQTLIESNINLHILMDGEIEMKKPRNEHKLFGFDRDLAYTNKYLKDSQGEKELRTEVLLPKQQLGTCLALAMISDGSVFTANKLKPGTKTSVKKFTAVFAKRVVKTAVPNACQTCECTGHNTGIAYISCTKCEFPISGSDYNLEEDYDMKTKYDDIDFNWGDEF